MHSPSFGLSKIYHMFIKMMETPDFLSNFLMFFELWKQVTVIQYKLVVVYAATPTLVGVAGGARGKQKACSMVGAT